MKSCNVGGGKERTLLFSDPGGILSVAHYSSKSTVSLKFLASTLPWPLTKIQVSVILCVLVPPNCLES